ncbi:hypothetical protein EVAR_94366_1 [Eumeta japonica]|uniref:Uncharacterized protein n=1 Tax=Eumeta variegata TaxID=151549 RepID=A0A4C1TPW5_EUMVA|nr:hypothetical protein EVAR_94366_1 [Eumeta japonica]
MQLRIWPGSEFPMLRWMTTDRVCNRHVFARLLRGRGEQRRVTQPKAGLDNENTFVCRCAGARVWCMCMKAFCEGSPFQRILLLKPFSHALTTLRYVSPESPHGVNPIVSVSSSEILGCFQDLVTTEFVFETSFCSRLRTRRINSPSSTLTDGAANNGPELDLALDPDPAPMLPSIRRQ